MNSNDTDVFEIIKKQFSDIFDQNDFDNNAELKSFIYYNTKNNAIMNSDIGCVKLKNLEDKSESMIYAKDGKIYYLIVANISNYKSFCISSKGIKCIKTNENGLFMEEFKFKGNGVTKFYDSCAQDQMTMRNINLNDIDNIEYLIQNANIMPDMIISYQSCGDKMFFTVEENDEVMEDAVIECDKDKKASYSTYYQYMRERNFFTDSKIKIYSKHI